MSKRVVIILGAVLAAGLLLWATMRWGGSGPKQERPETHAVLDLNQLPPGHVAGREGMAGVGGIGEAKHYTIESVNKKGQLIQTVGESLVSLPKGRLQVKKPVTRVFLAANRVMEVRAEEGEFFAPENQPRSGELSRDVVVRLLECPAGRRVDAGPGSGDEVLRIYLDDAKFDLELGRIDSDGPVKVAATQFDFLGKGLTLTYNDLRKRIDHLEVFHGDSLRIKAGRSAGRGAAKGGSAALGGAVNGVGRQKTREDEAGTFYQARFMDTVRVVHQDMVMEGEILSVYFGLGGVGSGDASSGADGSGVAARGSSGGAVAGGGAAASGPAEDDMMVTWAGRMVLEPEDRANSLEVGPGGALLAMAGQPVRIVGNNNQDRVSASSVEYFSGTGVVRLTGSKPYPLVIESPELGTLQGAQMVLETQGDGGRILGPGVLVGRGGGEGREDGAARGLTDGLRVEWRDVLGLRFYTAEDGGRGGAAGFGRLRALEAATFNGQVKVAHPSLDMTAQSLSLGFDDPAKGSRAARKIYAAGDVKADTRGRAEKDSLSIKSDELMIDLATDGRGRSRPSGMIAKGHVDSRGGGRKVTCGLLELGLDATSAEGAGRGPEGAYSSSGMKVSRLLAAEDARIVLDEPAAVLTGERIAGDAAADELALTGAPGKLARLEQPEGALAGERIILKESTQVVRVDGPGVFGFRSKAGGSGGNAEPIVIETSWSKAMRYDNKNSRADFAGGVSAVGKNKTSVSRLTADELSLEFVESGGEGGRGGGANQDAGLRVTSKKIQSMTARKGVVFQSDRFGAKGPGALESRFRVTGDLLTLESGSSAFAVVGPGTFFFQDVREGVKKDGGGQQMVPGGASFAGGRGATLFSWKKGLTFDAGRHEMEMVDGVEMLHRPADSEGVMQMNCRRMTADVDVAEGGGAWLADAAPSPGIKAVRATRDVQILWGERTIRTDQLLYTAGDNQILLQADAGKLTEVFDGGEEGASYSAQRLKWDLKTNRIEVMYMGPTRVPVR